MYNWPYPQQPCPSCGRCPMCGGYRAVPLQPLPGQLPLPQQPIGPYFPVGPTWTTGDGVHGPNFNITSWGTYASYGPEN